MLFQTISLVDHVDRTDRMLLLYCILSSFGSFNVPSHLISSMPYSKWAFLSISGSQFIFPFTTTHVVSVPLV